MVKRLLPEKIRNFRINHCHKIILTPILVILLFLALWNGLNQLVFAGKCPPNTNIGAIDVSGVRYKEVENKINSLLEDREINLKNKQLSTKNKISELGIKLKGGEAEKICRAKNPFLFKPWFIVSNNKIPINIDVNKISEKLVLLRDQEYKDPKDSRIDIKDNVLFVVESSDGYGINVEKSKDLIVDSLNFSNENINLELFPENLPPLISSEEVKTLLPEVEKITNASYKVKTRDNSITASKADILGVLVLNSGDGGLNIKYSKDAINELVKGWVKDAEKSPVNQVKEKYKSGKADKITKLGEVGYSVNNSDEIIEALLKVFENGELVYEGEFKFNENNFEEQIVEIDDTVRKRVVTYDVAVWGSIKSNLQEFENLAVQTYSDSRGWSAGGISFVKVASGGNFTLVLAEPSRVAGASSGCDSYYSCNVGRYVIINDDRWAGATSAWTGSLRDYRHMVINHETGHWLGHGHYNCQGVGQLAPVMQQQSINLQGCLFNPWPLEFEINKIKS